MRQEKFTEQAQEALATSREMVTQYHHSQWDVEHILLALLQQERGLVGDILSELGANAELVKQEVTDMLSKAPKVAYEGGQIYITPRINALMIAADAESKRLKDEFIGTEHLFIAIASEEKSETSAILHRLGIDKEKVYSALQKLRGDHRVGFTTHRGHTGSAVSVQVGQRNRRL